MDGSSIKSEMGNAHSPSDFPKDFNFIGALKPVRTEAKITDLTVEGEIPVALDGMFVRMQPDPLFPPMLGYDMFFNGDGLVCAFKFKNGKVDLLQRYVQTERYHKQMEAGRSLFGNYRNPHSNDPSVRDKVYSTGNTNVIAFRGKLLALKEDNLPWALDPDTLETLGMTDLDGQVNARTFTAHPKVCSTTGNLLSFAYRAYGELSQDVVFYEFDQHGNKVREIPGKAPFVPMIHDFGVTENYVVYPLIPLKQREDLGKNNDMIMRYDSKEFLYFGLMRRDGDGSDLRWMATPNGTPGHLHNVFERDGKVFVDLTLSDGNLIIDWPDEYGENRPIESIKVSLARVELDPNSPEAVGKVTHLLEGMTEMPRIDPRYYGKPYTYSYTASLDFSQWDFPNMGPPAPYFFNAIAKVDTSAGEVVEQWSDGPQICLQEPAFVPRSDQAPEGDGFLIVAATDVPAGTSQLLILDTGKLALGPIARIHCPVRLRQALHGNWISTEELINSRG